ncbi:MAG: DNA repair protein RadA [Bacteroidales bacterium]|nr:DNA repair protein RadA [Bacteroidales bacterium]
MAKVKKAFFCNNCGYESAKWLGQCPSCGKWNTMVEEVIAKQSGPTSKSVTFSTQSAKPIKLSDIEANGNEERIVLAPAETLSANGEANISELDRILGGGMVKGSLVLIGGEPGIGKSTLSLQIPLGCPTLKTLYVSGEESVRQIKMRAERLGGAHESCYILSETSLENILEQAKQIAPQLLIIDSIQTIFSQLIESSAGSVSQVRECAAALLRFAKESNTPVILIGHITKDGTIAGPKVLEHIVDVVLQFEGDTRHSFRILRSIKNRFGASAELAVYEMTGGGLREILNPSEMFISTHNQELSGTAVAAMLDGTRPFLIEVQALVSTAAYGTPQRSATGFDVRRMNMLLAVLEKRVGFKLSVKDVFLNIAGGIKISDPACDLAIVMSILSSNFDVAVNQKIAFAAEIGLSGEVRPVSQIERRISEAEKLGFEKIYISSFNQLQERKYKKIKVVCAANVPQIVREVFQEGS